MDPNFVELERLLVKYPGLDFLLLGGVITNKLCRTLLDIDRWEMEDLQGALIKAMCVRGLSNSSFRAVPQVEEYIRERIAQKEQEV